MLPLNGTKTHPLSEHAKDVLRILATEALPTNAINAGVINRLRRENLAEIKMLPSPYKTHNGKNTAHLVITDAGRAATKALNP